MNATEQLLEKVRTLTPEQIHLVSDFIDGLDGDEGVDEDAEEANRRYDAIKKNGGYGLLTSDELRK